MTGDARSSDVERDALHETLRELRAHALGIVDGLTDAELRRSVVPSGWTPAGLIRHLAVDVEEFWFCYLLDGQPFDEDEFGSEHEATWRLGPADDPAAVMARYRLAGERASAVIARTPLDAPLAHWPTEQWPTQWWHTLRDLLHHVITETAVHCGHLDIARELVDGRQWMVMGRDDTG